MERGFLRGIVVAASLVSGDGGQLACPGADPTAGRPGVGGLLERQAADPDQADATDREVLTLKNSLRQHRRASRHRPGRVARRQVGALPAGRLV